MNICFSIPISPHDGFYSQVAMFRLALNKLGGLYSSATILISLGDSKISPIPKRWRNYLGKNTIFHWADPKQFQVFGQRAQGNNRWSYDFDSYDVVIFCDADVILLRSINEMLSEVKQHNQVSGVIAHYPPVHLNQIENEDLMWQFLAVEINGKDIELRYKYSLMKAETPCPFYLNFGFVAMTPSIINSIRSTYLGIRPQVEPKLKYPRFSGQVALTLALHKYQVLTQSLDMIYNFPNDPIADALYPDQLKDIAVLHYLRTDKFDRQKIFTTKEAFDDFLSLELEGSNKVFQEYIRKITQGQYPFTYIDSFFSKTKIIQQTKHFYKRIKNQVNQKIEMLVEKGYKIRLRLKYLLKLVHNIQLMKLSNLFDARWYVENNPDVANAKVNPYLHYLRYGGFEGRDPSPSFSSKFYLDSNPDVKETGINPLIHYLKFGKKEKRLSIQIYEDKSKPDLNRIPASELDEMLNLMKSTPGYLNSDYVASRYREYGLEVFPDPFSLNIVNHIKQALIAQKPYSVIRIGDGEANLISLHAYPQMSNLSHYVFEQYISSLIDSFQLSPLWKIIIQDLLMGAIAQTDILGVPGMWPPIKNSNVENQYQKFLMDFRGGSGVWTSIDFLLKMAENGFLDNKIIGSAHLYFGILENLSEILSVTNVVYLISSKGNLSIGLNKKYPDSVIKYIPTGNDQTFPSDNSPEFLFVTQSNLPRDMRNSLSLVGAGPWAKIYCSWIKQRGGVAVDIGSGFDLLDGEISRPVHTYLELDKHNKYALYS